MSPPSARLLGKAHSTPLLPTIYWVRLSWASLPFSVLALATLAAPAPAWSSSCVAVVALLLAATAVVGVHANATPSLPRRTRLTLVVTGAYALTVTCCAVAGLL